MTLPFRRRHNDAEAPHERARSLAGERLLAPLDAAEATWLEAHLGECPECAVAAEGFAADQLLLRSLRDTPPVPPRDLWARTAAAIERSPGRGRHEASRPSARQVFGRPGSGQLAALSGALVVVVLVGVSVLSGPGLSDIDPSDAPSSASAGPAATPFSVTANRLSWLGESDDGSFTIHVAALERVCADDPRCAPLDDAVVVTLRLPQAPESVVLSPSSSEVVVITGGEGTSSILVVPVPVPVPAPEPSETPSPAPSGEPTPPVSPTVEPSPDGSADPSAPPTPEPTPEGAVEIARGVTIVGEASYSPDGTWFAFAARPSDGSGGPDVYSWHVGEAAAARLTTDGRTVFAGWVGPLILVSHVDEEPGYFATPADSPSPSPASSPSSSADPSQTPEQVPPDPPTHFAFASLLDPATGTRSVIEGGPMWRPVVDPTGSRVVYWDGLVSPTDEGGWRLAAGRLVIDGWVSGAPDGTPTPDATAEPPFGPGPAERPVVLVEPASGMVDFDARFDPTGTRLAVWIDDGSDASEGRIGRLHLFVIDSVTGTIDPDVTPLPGVPALRGFSIQDGRLAWVTPPGQDGDESRVSVLAWRDGQFGWTESDPSRELRIVR